MWAHCFLMDWPLDKPKCSSPQSTSPHCPALARWVTVTCPVPGMNIAKCTTAIRPGEVRAVKPTLTGARAKTVQTFALWAHFAHLDFRLSPALFYIIFPLSWFHFLPTLPPPSSAAPLPRALFNFKFHLLRTVCLSRFLFSFLVYLFSYLINLCLPQCVCLCVCLCAILSVCMCVPVALWLWPMSENCPLRVIYFKALLGLKTELGRVSNLNFIFSHFKLYTVLHNYICHTNCVRLCMYMAICHKWFAIHVIGTGLTLI